MHEAAESPKRQLAPSNPPNTVSTQQGKQSVLPLLESPPERCLLRGHRGEGEEAERDAPRGRVSRGARAPPSACATCGHVCDRDQHRSMKTPALTEPGTPAVRKRAAEGQWLRTPTDNGQTLRQGEPVRTRVPGHAHIGLAFTETQWVLRCPGTPLPPSPFFSKQRAPLGCRCRQASRHAAAWRGPRQQEPGLHSLRSLGML